jgi:hypothetical protein
MTEILSSNHNASYPAEQERVKSEHPEDEKEACMLNNRVLGAIAVSRGGQLTSLSFFDH